MKTLRVVSFVSLVNALIVGSCLIFDQEIPLVIYATISGLVAFVSQLVSFFDAVNPTAPLGNDVD